MKVKVMRGAEEKRRDKKQDREKQQGAVAKQGRKMTVKKCSKDMLERAKNKRVPLELIH